MPEKGTENTSEHSAKKSDYVEIRVPKLLTRTAPVNLFLLGLSLLLTFLLGIATMRIYQLENGAVSAAPTDAISAFAAYAKKLMLNAKDFQSCLETNKYAQKVKDDYAAGQQAQVNATPAFFINGQPLVGAQPYSVFKAVIEQELSGKPVATPTSDPLITGEPEPTLAKQNVAVGNLPALGRDSAPVTIVEFSDMQCPFCKRFFDDTFSQLKKDYIDTGKVRMTFRHYPLNFHKNAQKAAEATECANEQGKFWEYHDLLFQTQDSWAELPTTPVAST